MIVEAFDFERKLTPEKIWQGRFKVRVLSSDAGDMSLDQAVPVQYDDGQLQIVLQSLETRDAGPGRPGGAGAHSGNAIAAGRRCRDQCT